MSKMAEINLMVKCPYCGKESMYGDVAYDGYGFDIDHDAILETEVMRCENCGKQYFATVKYTFAEVTTSIKESE